MSSLVKLCAALRTARESSYSKNMFNSAPVLGVGFSRPFGTTSPPTDDPPKDGERPRRPRKPQVKVKFFIQLHDETRHEVQFIAGWMLSQAVGNFPKIIGGGFGACNMKGDCSTCHVKFSKEVYETLEPITDLEKLTLKKAQGYEENASRLSCCVKLTEAMEGITIYLPKRRRDIRDI